MPIVPDLNPRKDPKQDRSRQMKKRILDASIRVLAAEGALGFTTTRVAEAAEISVGSLYQYFPNKHALVAALHDENIREGWGQANLILDNEQWSDRRKLTELTRWYFATEAEEAQTFGVATGDIETFLHSQSGDRRNPALMTAVVDRARSLILSASSMDRTAAQLRSDAELLVTTVQAVAKAAASRKMSKSQNERWADQIAAMLAEQLSFDE